MFMDEIFFEMEFENVYIYNVNYFCVVFGDRLNIYSVYNEKLKKKYYLFIFLYYWLFLYFFVLNDCKLYIFFIKNIVYVFINNVSKSL